MGLPIRPFDKWYLPPRAKLTWITSQEGNDDAAPHFLFFVGPGGARQKKETFRGPSKRGEKVTVVSPIEKFATQ